MESNSPEENTSLADTRVADEQQLEEQVVGFLGHGAGAGLHQTSPDWQGPPGIWS